MPEGPLPAEERAVAALMRRAARVDGSPCRAVGPVESQGLPYAPDAASRQAPRDTLLAPPL